MLGLMSMLSRWGQAPPRALPPPAPPPPAPPAGLLEEELLAALLEELLAAAALDAARTVATPAATSGLASFSYLGAAAEDIPTSTSLLGPRLPHPARS